LSNGAGPDQKPTFRISGVNASLDNHSIAVIEIMAFKTNIIRVCINLT
jgi:hypothetical protein